MSVKEFVDEWVGNLEERAEEVREMVKRWTKLRENK